MLDLDFLFDEVIGRRRPLSEAGLSVGPEVRAVAVSVARAELRVLSGFESVADLLSAARASCAIPVLTGTPPLYGARPTVDGGLMEPIPYRTAIRERATAHVLVLRSRGRGLSPAPPSTAGSRSGRSLARILSWCRCCACAALSTTSTLPGSSVGRGDRRESRTCGRSPFPRAAVWCRGFSIDHGRIGESVPAGSTHDGVRALWRRRDAVPAVVCPTSCPPEAAITPPLAA